MPNWENPKVSRTARFSNSVHSWQNTLNFEAFDLVCHPFVNWYITFNGNCNRSLFKVQTLMKKIPGLFQKNIVYIVTSKLSIRFSTILQGVALLCKFTFLYHLKMN